MSSLVILAASDFKISRGKADRQTDRQTNVQTNTSSYQLPGWPTWRVATAENFPTPHPRGGPSYCWQIRTLP